MLCFFPLQISLINIQYKLFLIKWIAKHISRLWIDFSFKKKLNFIFHCGISRTIVGVTNQYHVYNSPNVHSSMFESRAYRKLVTEFYETLEACTVTVNTNSWKRNTWIKVFTCKNLVILQKNDAIIKILLLLRALLVGCNEGEKHE